MTRCMCDMWLSAAFQVSRRATEVAPAGEREQHHEGDVWRVTCAVRCVMYAAEAEANAGLKCTTRRGAVLGNDIIIVLINHL